MINLIGMGPGDIDYLTFKALKIIKDSKCIVAFGRISKSINELREDYIVAKKVDDIKNILQNYKDVCILASGDPGFYGILNFLKDNEIHIDNVIPGISSMQYMMAKLKISWHDAKFVSFHGRDLDLDSIIGVKKCVVLTDKYNTPCNISKILYENNIRGNFYVGFNLSYNDEVIIKCKIGDLIEDISSLSVVIFENEMGL